MPVGYVACPVCTQPAPTFNGGWVLLCASCLVTAYARQQGHDPEPSLIWALVPFDAPLIHQTPCETRPRVLEPV